MNNHDLAFILLFYLFIGFIGGFSAGVWFESHWDDIEARLRKVGHNIAEKLKRKS